MCVCVCVCIHYPAIIKITPDAKGSRLSSYIKSADVNTAMYYLAGDHQTNGCIAWIRYYWIPAGSS